MPSIPISVLPPQAMPQIAAAGARQHDKAVVEAAKSFESILLTQLVQEMGNTVEDGGMLEETGGKQVMDMFYYHLAQDLSSKGGLGLWKSIARQIAPSQAAAAEVRP
ncbi:MAG: rod-binding protein [Planctomycetaceae bacterium]|nr:rod-binding protein [Planctomycetaceae bacterium]